jgi:hypothetical protein
MIRTTKAATALALAGALAISAATPSFARNGRVAAGVIGFAAGTMLGAAAASAAHGPYYGNGYAYEPSYAYAPAYGYGGYASYNDPTVSPYSQRVEQRHDPYGIRGCASEGAYRPDYTLC